MEVDLYKIQKRAEDFSGDISDMVSGAAIKNERIETDLK
jgi:hypothetical protein